jgi:hypothetical protein
VVTNLLTNDQSCGDSFQPTINLVVTSLPANDKFSCSSFPRTINPVVNFPTDNQFGGDSFTHQRSIQ